MCFKPSYSQPSLINEPPVPIKFSQDSFKKKGTVIRHKKSILATFLNKVAYYALSGTKIVLE